MPELGRFLMTFFLYEVKRSNLQQNIIIIQTHRDNASCLNIDKHFELTKESVLPVSLKFKCEALAGLTGRQL